MIPWQDGISSWDLYIFYHRPTNAHSFSRQGCIEPIEILPDGSIPQVEVTSCGPNGGPLKGEGYYPGYIVCNLYSKNEPDKGVNSFGKNLDVNFPYVMQDEPDGDCIGKIPVKGSNEWKKYTTDIAISDGVQALYFEYQGYGFVSFNGFTLESDAFHE